MDGASRRPYRPGGTLVQGTPSDQRWQTGHVPLTHGWNYFLAPFLALALVGGLALVLKWTFSDVDA